MPSSGYTAITFVANEQPTTAKWNLIGSNDASFNTGNGFNDGIIVPRHLAASAATTSKVKLNAIDWEDAGSSAVAITSTSYIDVTGISTTYTSGDTPEKLFICAQFMALGAGGNYGFFFTINVNGTDTRTHFLTALNNVWNTVSKWTTVDIPANTTVTIKLRAKVGASSNVTISRDTADSAYRPKFIGFAISNA